MRLRVQALALSTMTDVTFDLDIIYLKRRLLSIGSLDLNSLCPQLSRYYTHDRYRTVVGVSCILGATAKLQVDCPDPLPSSSGDPSCHPEDDHFLLLSSPKHNTDQPTNQPAKQPTSL